MSFIICCAAVKQKFKMNLSDSREKLYSLNQSKSLSIHQGGPNSIFIFSELKQQQRQDNSALQAAMEEIENLALQLAHEQEQCSILQQEIDQNKESYNKFKADLELFIQQEEEELVRIEKEQQEQEVQKLNKKTEKLICKARSMLNKSDGRDVVRKVF